MLFLTAATLGIVAGMTRSAFSVAIVAALIAATFALASGLSAGPIHYAALFIAIGGYNCGLLGLVTAVALTRGEEQLEQD